MTLLRSKRQWPRKLLVFYCLVSLGLSGCAQKRVAVQSPPSPYTANGNKPSDKQPTAVGDYVQLVFGPSRRDHGTEDTSSGSIELDELREQIANSPEDLQARKDLISALMELGLFLDAISALEELQQLSPKDQAIEVGLARAWVSLGDHDRALTHARQAIEIDSSDAEAFLLAGQALLGQEQPGSALVMLQKALAIDAANSTVLAEMGRACLKTQRWVEASQYLTLALEQDPDSKGRRQDLAFALAHMGRQQEALRQYLELYSEADALTQLGNVLMKQERWAEARDIFETVLDLKPTHAEAKLNLFEAESYTPIPSVVTIPSFKELAVFRENQSEPMGPVLAFLNEELTELPLDQLPMEGIECLTPIYLTDNAEIAALEYTAPPEVKADALGPIEAMFVSSQEESPIVALTQVVMTTGPARSGTRPADQPPTPEQVPSEPAPDQGYTTMVVPTVTLRSYQATPANMPLQDYLRNLQTLDLVAPEAYVGLAELPVSGMKLFGLPALGSEAASAALPAHETEDTSLVNALVIPTTSLRVQTIPRFEPSSITQVDLPAWPEPKDFREIALVTPDLAVSPTMEVDTETAAVLDSAPVEQGVTAVPDFVPDVPLQTESASPAEPLRIAKTPFDLPLSTEGRSEPEGTWLFPGPVPVRVAVASAGTTDDPPVIADRVRSEVSSFWADAAISIVESLNSNVLSLFGLVLFSLFGLGVGVFQRRLTTGPRGKF